jgi:hypothetical protein
MQASFPQSKKSLSERLLVNVRDSDSESRALCTGLKYEIEDPARYGQSELMVTPVT